MEIAGILFDKDGTLFDFRKSWGRWASGFLADLAPDSDRREALAQAIGFLPGSESFHPDSPVIAGTVQEVAGAMLPHLPGRGLEDLVLQIDLSAEGIEMVEATPLLPLMEGFRRRGLRLGIATNDSERPARQHLKNHQLIDIMDFIAGWDSGFGAKPGPGMCLAFAAQTGLDPARVVMVGDSLHDLTAGRAAGMQTIAVLTGIADAADLAPHADVVLPDIGAIPGWLDRR